MNIELKSVGDLCIAKIKERKIDASISDDFKSNLLDLLEEGKNKILLNLEDVEFIDSSALGVLITIAKKMLSTKGTFACCQVSEPVRRVFTITHVNNFFPIYEDEEEALKNIKTEPQEVASSETEKFQQLKKLAERKSADSQNLSK